MKARKIGYSVNITIPKDVIEQMGIKDGDKLDYKVEDLKLIITNPNDIIYDYQENQPEILTDAELQIEYEALKNLEEQSVRIDEQIKLQNEWLSKIKKG